MRYNSGGQELRYQSLNSSCTLDVFGLIPHTVETGHAHL